MDKRRSSRTPLRQRVGVECSHTGAMSAYTRNVSLGGMFIETGSLGVPPNAPVTVSFSLQHDGVVDRFTLGAAVVRRAPEGVGLMFLEMGPEVIRALSRALARYH